MFGAKEKRMMRCLVGHRLLRALLLFPAILFVTCAAASATESLRYELRFEKPNTHLMDVTIHASDLKGSTVEFAMPDCAPGSYNIENYAANVQRFRATGTGDKALVWRKTDSQTWR